MVLRSALQQASRESATCREAVICSAYSCEYGRKIVSTFCGGCRATRVVAGNRVPSETLAEELAYLGVCRRVPAFCPS